MQNLSLDILVLIR